MTKPSVDELLTAESRLNRSFVACVLVVLAGLGWTIFMAKTSVIQGKVAGLVALGLLILQLGCYVWYAISAGGAAKTLGDASWKYVLWILVAPFLALVPIPIVSTIIGVSPLGIKFLLGGQLQSEIRERTWD